MELLLCNQAGISHRQPITKLSFPKQFVYGEIYKSWLTLQAETSLLWEQAVSKCILLDAILVTLGLAGG